MNDNDHVHVKRAGGVAPDGGVWHGGRRMDELRAEAERYLRALAGEKAVLREDQWVAIAALVVERKRALVVQRTGWGKWRSTSWPRLLLRARGAGPTVIVKPAARADAQPVAAAERAGIRAVTVNSSNVTEWSECTRRTARGGGRAARQPRTAQQSELSR